MTHDERLKGPEIASSSVFNERRSQMTFAEDSVADSDMKMTSGFAPGHIKDADVRRL